MMINFKKAGFVRACLFSFYFEKLVDYNQIWYAYYRTQQGGSHNGLVYFRY